MGLTAAAALLLTVTAAQPAAAQFTITANFASESQSNGTNAPSAAADADVQAALNTLAASFSTNGSAAFNLKADVSWADQGASTLGTSSAGSGDYQTVTGAQVGDAFNPTVLLNNDLDRYLLGVASTVNTSGGYADFTLQFNNNGGVIWDYTQTAPSNFSSYSLASVVTHEALHSMGFSAFNNSDGSYFTKANGGQGDPAPTIWDTKMFDATTGKAFTADSQADRQAVMISGDANGNGGKLFFAGANAKAANGGANVQLFAPSVFQDGSSDGSHFGPNLTDPMADLLNPALSNGSYLTASALDLGALQDIGWKLAGSGSPAVPEASTTLSFGLLLTLGLGSILVARKRKAASTAN